VPAGVDDGGEAGEPLAIDAQEVGRLAEAARHVRGEIEAACRRVGRDPRGVRLVAVSKTVPAVRLRAAVAAGLTDLGENRVQEAAEKVDDVSGATWHLVGPLQANKARRAIEIFSMVQTVDSGSLAARLDRLVHLVRPGARQPVLLQVNVDADPAKAGWTTSRLEADLAEVLDLPAIDVRGLMTVGRLVTTAEAARPTFTALRQLSERLRARYPALGPELSMGMSADFQVAVEEGATIVRVGRALFGARPAAAG
jgi:pyridoxal phosphate enzyme (YggS family)